MAKHTRFIVTSVGSIYGTWGSGATLEAAESKRLQSKGKKSDSVRVMKFESDMPFAPSDREAARNEADAYVAKDGSIHWVRCDRTMDEERSGTAKTPQKKKPKLRRGLRRVRLAFGCVLGVL